MNRTVFLGCFLLALSLTQTGRAQSTTGGRSGGSSASTGAGYTSPGKRPAASKPASMTIADEGASRDYMYVPPKKAANAKNRSASPDGSGSSTHSKTAASKQTSGKP